MKRGLIVVIALGVVLLLVVIVLVVALSGGGDAGGGTIGGGGGTIGGGGGTIGGGGGSTVASPEVYLVGGDRDYSQEFDFAAAGGACSALGARLASESEVQSAQQAGAGWCHAGWTSDQKALWPLQASQYSGGCGNSPMMYATYGVAPAANKYGAVCYGPKPARGTGSPIPVTVPWGPSGWSK